MLLPADRKNDEVLASVLRKVSVTFSFDFETNTSKQKLGGYIMNKKYQIAVDDSLSGKTVIVEFKDKVVYDTCRRSEWKIENNDHKHAEKESPFSSLIGGENGAFENFDEFR